MKLTGELKKRVKKANSVEEVKKIIKDAGFELSDEEVESVAGGWYPGKDTRAQQLKKDSTSDGSNFI